MTTLTDDERIAKLAALGLATDGDTLADPAAAKPKAAPQGINPHTMPITDIVFDPKWIAQYDLSTGVGFKAASDAVFAMFRSPTKDKDRHSLLHKRITAFVGQVKADRRTGGHVRNEIKATSEERALAKLLASKGLTVEDLAALLNNG